MSIAVDRSIVVRSPYHCIHLPISAPPDAKNKFYRKLSRLLSVHSTDVVVAASDSNTQLGQLAETRQHIEDRFYASTGRTDHGDHLIEVCSDHRLFLANANFCYKERHRITWCPPLSFTTLDSDLPHCHRSPAALIS